MGKHVQESSIFDGLNVKSPGQASGTWNTGHYEMGLDHFWFDTAGQLRTKRGAPDFDTDGRIVGGSTRKDMTYGPSMRPNLDDGNTFIVAVTNTTAFTITAPNNPFNGQRIQIVFRNLIGAGQVFGAVTMTGFECASATGQAFNASDTTGICKAPAYGYQRSIEFEYSGTKWEEIRRTPADVHYTIVTPGAHAWTTTFTPPALTTPTTITLDGTNYLVNTGAVDLNKNGVHYCVHSGVPYYQINLDNGTDYIIRCSAVLPYGLYLNGGRNVRVVGLHMDIQPYCSHGFTTGQTDATPITYAFGCIPSNGGSIALRLEQVGTTYVEGLYIDVHGAATDVSTVRNKAGYNTRASRDVVFQNCVVRGIRGDDNIHADFCQAQYIQNGANSEMFRDLKMENVSIDGTSQGLMMAPYYNGTTWDNTWATSNLKNVDYRKDTRYGYGTTGNFTFLSSASETYSEVYTYPQPGIGTVSHYPTPSGSPVAYTSAQATAIGIHYNAFPPGSDRFAAPGTGDASSAWVGLNYVSPHG